MLTIPYNIHERPNCNAKNLVSFGTTAHARNFQELSQVIFDKKISTILVDWNISNAEVTGIVRDWYSMSKGTVSGDNGIISKTGGKGFFQEFHNSHLTEDSSIDRQNFIYYLKILLNKKPSEIKILDAGCGEGKEVKIFKGLGYNVSGFDASSDCVNMAREISGAQIDNATFNDYKSNKRFDAIFTRKALQHVAKSGFEGALQNLINHLNPNGFLFVVTKLDNQPINGVGRQLFNQNRLFHNFLTEREIFGISSNLHGAKLMHMETTPNPNAYDITDTTNVLFILKKDT